MSKFFLIFLAIVVYIFYRAFLKPALNRHQKNDVQGKPANEQEFQKRHSNHIEDADFEEVSD